MTEVKTYLTPGQSQALYAAFLKSVKEHEGGEKVLYYLAFMVLPMLVLIGFNIIIEDMALRALVSVLLLASSFITEHKAKPEARSAIIAAIADLELYEKYEVYARAIADTSPLGQEIAAILMEPDEDAYGDKPSATIRVQIICQGTLHKQPCNHTFAAIVSCPAWGQDDWEIDCPVCGCNNLISVNGSMVDDRSGIDRLEAVGKPAAPIALIAGTSTMRLDESAVTVQVLR